MADVNFTIDLTGDVALVTGASSGLGARFAQVLAACGAKVAIVARRKERLDDLERQIGENGGEAATFQFDVADVEQIPTLVDAIEERLGRVSILVNNAGITAGRRAVNMTSDLLDDMFDSNLRGPFMLACEVAKRLIAAEKPGRVVNIASIGAFVCSQPGQSAYSVSKSGVVRMTEVLAVEWAPHFINVNAIAPGTFRSEMIDAYIDKIGDYSDRLPRKRYGEPEQLDSTLLFLVSPSSDAVTGTIIKVDDGQTGR